MNLPIKVNLMLSTTLPGINPDASGGGSSDIINNIKNKTYKYLITKPRSEHTVVLGFDDNLNIVNENPYSNFMDIKNKTVYFGVKYYREFNTSLNLPQVDLVLRCFDNLNDDGLKNFIQKWKNDKRNFNNNIINIFLYGNIYNGERYVSSFILTKKYNDYSDILRFDMDETIFFYSRLIEFLNELKGLNMIYRDLKFSNIGYEKLPEGQIQFIVLEYDNLTLLNLNDEFFNGFKLTGCNNKYCGGTLIPYYVIHDYFYSNPDWLSRLDKLYCLGLFEITMCLFFKDEKNFHELYKLLSGISSLKSSLYYHHLITIFDDIDKYLKIQNNVYDLVCKFVQINPILDKFLHDLMINLIVKPYEIIWYPKYIINMFNKILPGEKEFDGKPNGTTIHPIGSLLNYSPTPKQIEDIFNDKFESRNKQVEKKIELLGGDDQTYYKKMYLKYKFKYIKLKNSFK